MSFEQRDENIKVTLEPTAVGAERGGYTAEVATQPGDVALNVTLRNDGDSPLTIDLWRASIPSLTLEVVDAEGRPVLLPPPPVPGKADENRKLIRLAPGETQRIQLAGFLDQGLPAGTYRVRYRHAETATNEGSRRVFTSDWVEVVTADARLPRAEQLTQPIERRGILYRFSYYIFCLVVYRVLRFGKRCNRVASAEVSRQITEVITNASPGNEAWNGTYGWTARFNLTLDQRDCTVTVVVRVRINGAITAAQRNAWESVIEAQWGNRFKLCCREDCCQSCCPGGYTVVADVQFVASGEHFVVNAGASTVNMGNWGAADAVDVAHEFGHMLGNPDEYFTVNGVAYGEGRQPGGTIMNNPANHPVARHYDIIREEAARLVGAGATCAVKGVGEKC
jgi:hypothetical protein